MKVNILTTACLLALATCTNGWKVANRIDSAIKLSLKSSILSQSLTVSNKNYALSSTQLFGQYGSNRRYVGEVIERPSLLNKFSNTMKRLLSLVVSIILFPFKLTFSIATSPFRLIAFIFAKIFKKAPVTVATIPTSVVVAAVQDDVKVTQKSVEKQLVDIDKAKKESDESSFAAKLAAANLAAENSAEKEREKARAFALSIKATLPTVDDDQPTATSFNDFFAEESSSKDKIKAAGENGVISYIATEFAFWAISFPIILSSYHTSTGEWLNFANEVDKVVFNLLPQPISY